ASPPRTTARAAPVARPPEGKARSEPGGPGEPVSYSARVGVLREAWTRQLRVQGGREMARVATCRSAGVAMGVRLVVPGVVVMALACAQAAYATTVVFSSTAAEQTFTVPADVGIIHVAAVGGEGGPASDANGGAGGFGASAAADLAVRAGEVLYIEV